MSWRLYHNFQGLILVGWGLFILEKLSSGRLLLLINNRYIFVVVLAALMFFVLAQAVMSYRRDQRSDSQQDVEHTCSGEECAGAGHMHGPSGWALLALALPLLLGVMVPIRALDSNVMSMRGLNTTAPSIGLSGTEMTTVTLSSEERSVLDWVGLFNSASDFSAYEGQTVDVTGFVYRPAGLAEGSFVVGRFVVTCCVADATALGMLVSGADDEQLSEDQWVRVRGRLYTAHIDGQPLPAIEAEIIDFIEKPEQPYLYP